MDSTPAIHVIVDGRNVMRSTWPNLDEQDLVARCSRWAERESVQLAVVFDGRYDGAGPGEWDVDQRTIVVATAGRIADDVIVAEAERLAADGIDVLVVSSDRGLRDRLPARTRVRGGGSYLRELLD
jgi:predicted RNA-binding protein with PIN domain